jgi:hypothetical protein
VDSWDFEFNVVVNSKFWLRWWSFQVYFIYLLVYLISLKNNRSNHQKVNFKGCIFENIKGHGTRGAIHITLGEFDIK